MNSEQLTYNFVEYAVNTYRSNKVFSIQEIKKSEYEGKTDCYLSMFRYPKTFYDHVGITKSVSGYGGLISFDHIYLDFDCAENINQAKQDLEIFIRYGLGIFVDYEDLEKLRVSFSGSKGFTLAIPKSFIGNIKPCENMNLKVKGFIKHLCELVKDETGSVPYTIDFQIYDKVRVIRLNNTINSKSGLYKIPMLYSELIAFTMDEILELAKQKRYIEYSNEITANEQLAEIFESISIEQERKPEINFNDIDNELFSIVNIGNRNNKAFEIASRLRYHNLPFAYIRGFLEMWNSRITDPLPAEEIDTIIKSVGKYEPHVTNNVIDRNSFANFQDRETEYKKYISELSHKKINTGFDTIDKKLRGIRPGNIFTILAQTGIGKSAICQNMISYHLNNNDEIVLFFSIEMDNIDIFERELQLEMDLASSQIEDTYKNNLSIEKININQQNNFITITKPIDIKQIPAYVSECEKIFNKKVSLIYIDYLGLIHNEKFQKVEYDRITDCIRKIQEHGKITHIPHGVISQIKRGNVKERIDMFSAKSSGDIENSSHLVFALEKVKENNIDMFVNDDNRNLGVNENMIKELYHNHYDLLCFTILKNRRGGRAEIFLLYNRINLRMTEFNGNLPFHPVKYKQETF